MDLIHKKVGIHLCTEDDGLFIDTCAQMANRIDLHIYSRPGGIDENRVDLSLTLAQVREMMTDYAAKQEKAKEAVND